MSSIVKFNIDDFVTGGKLPFNESEKNLAAFKGLFSVTNTSNFHDSFKRERFAKNFNVYPDDVISNASKIPLENLEINVKPSKIRTWVTGSNLLKLDGSTCYDPMERLYRGHFSESILEEGNPNIEKIICPLTKIQGASNQFYTLFAKENLTAQEYSDIYSGLPSEPNGETEYRFISGTRKIEVDQFTNEFPTDGHLIYTDKIDELTHIPGALVGPVSLTNLGQLNSVFGTKQGTLTLKEADPSLIFDERKHILKNFITPFKFGTGYNVKIHASFLGNGNRTSLAGSPNDDLAVFPDSETSNPFLGSIPASSADQINPTGGPSGFVENNSKWFSAGFVDEDGNKAMLCRLFIKT